MACYGGAMTDDALQAGATTQEQMALLRKSHENLVELLRLANDPAYRDQPLRALVDMLPSIQVGHGGIPIAHAVGEQPKKVLVPDGYQIPSTDIDELTVQYLDAATDVIRLGELVRSLTTQVEVQFQMPIDVVSAMILMPLLQDVASWGDHLYLDVEGQVSVKINRQILFAIRSFLASREAAVVAIREFVREAVRLIPEDSNFFANLYAVGMAEVMMRTARS